MLVNIRDLIQQKKRGAVITSVHEFQLMDMIITAEIFDMLSFGEQGALVFTKGNYISQMKYQGQKFGLYSLNGYLVEVSLDPETEEINGLRRLEDDDPRIEYYFRDVNLESILS